MGYGRYPYGGVGYAAADVGDIPQDDTDTILSVEVAFTTGALEEPVWVDVTADVRAWDTTRGRGRELERMQPGRATIVLANRERQYDSHHATGPHYGNLKPMRRVRIRETFNGVTYPIFDGFVDGWHLDYPEMGLDATATIVATDAFKIFGRTDLPRSVYDDLVLAAAPDVYWRLDETKQAEEDTSLVALNYGTLGPAANGTYVGPPELGGEALVVNDPGSSMGVVSSDASPGTGDMGVQTASSVFTLNPTTTTAWVAELWCIPSQDPGVNGTLFCQRAAGGSVDIHCYYTAANTFVLNVFADATDYSVNTSPTTYQPHARYHIVTKVVPGESVKMWVNGVLHDDVDVMGPDYDELPGLFSVGTLGAAGGFNWDGAISHFAVWRGAAAVAFGSTQVAEHYAAGTHPWQDDQPAGRAGRVLDEIGWPAGWRNLDTGNVALQSASFGHTALEHLQKVAETEFGLLFMGRDGNVRLVGREALFGRDPDPAVIGDGAGEVGHKGLEFDDGDTVIRNRATISRLNGVAKTTADTGSETEFGRFDYALDGLLHRADSYSLDYANLIVGEYHEPRRRVTGLALGPPAADADATLLPQMLGRELGDAVLVKDTPLGGGDRFEQTCVIEGVTQRWDPHAGRTAAWVLSPEFLIRTLEEEDVATLGYAEATTNQNAVAGDLTGLSVAVTVGANRRVRIIGFVGEAQNTTANAGGFIRAQEGATVLAQGDWMISAAGTATIACVMAVETPSAGAHTYKLAGGVQGGGVFNLLASATAPAFILVEDIGPA